MVLSGSVVALPISAELRIARSTPAVVERTWRNHGDAWNHGEMRFRFGEFWLDEERFALEGPRGPVHLEPQVFELLRLLVLQRNRVVTKQELLDVVWGSRFVSESALTSRIKSARRAVGDDGKRQCVIKTVQTVGYQFVAEVQTDTVGEGSAEQRLFDVHPGPRARGSTSLRCLKKSR